MVIPKGYKKTDVGVIPDDWEVKSLGDLFSFSGGFTASRDQLSDEGHCYLHYGDIHKSNKTYIDVSKEYQEIPKLNVDLGVVPKKSLLNDGDVVFVDASEDDEGTSKHVVVRNPKKINYISGLHTIVAKSKDGSVDNTYKQFCFQTRGLKKQFLFYAVGTKVSGISKSNISKIQISIPATTNEQAVVAKTLSDTDELIRNLEDLIVKKQNIKQGAMQELLTGKKRLPGFTGKWETKTFGSVIDIHKGQQLNRSELTEKGDYPAWNGGIEPSGYTTKWNTSENTITISEGGNSCGFVNFCKEKFWCGGHCYVVNIKEVDLQSTFLHQLLKFKEKLIMSLRIGSGLPNIQRKNLDEFELYVPESTEEQSAIAQILSDMDAEIEQLEQKLDKYKQIKQGMMQELLTGKIRLVSVK